MATMRSRIFSGLLMATAVLLVLFLFNLPSLTVEWLWLGSLGFTSVFWTMKVTQVGLFVLGFALTGAYLGLNIYGVSRYFATQELSMTDQGRRGIQIGEATIALRYIYGLLGAGAILLALLFGAILASQWDVFLQYVHAAPYNQADPVFQNDIAFYLFELPFLELIETNLASITLLTTLLLALFYAYTGGFTYYQQFNRLRVKPWVAKHLTLNGILLLGSWAWGYYLDRYDLLFNAQGVIFGAGYTDMMVKHPALWVMVVLSVGLMVLLVINLFQQRYRRLAWGVGIFAAAHIVGLILLPNAVQQFSVEPNELAMERPYIEQNIKLTREGYRIDAIQEQAYEAKPRVSRNDAQQSQATIDNVRLWDPRLALNTYQQLQEIRPYYQFYDVDLDRYTLDRDGYRQVMLSARELSQQLPQQSRTWVNRHLQYTHGYGLTMNPVAEEGEGGFPNFLIKDLPPVTTQGLPVDQAAIYYGEQTPTYHLVNTNVQEFDYPKGEQNVYVNYQGTGGVTLDSYWKKLLFAYYQGDINILLTEYLTPDSKIQMWKRVRQRVRQIAPFLDLDPDPYLALADGKLYWIMDAYTTSRNFPYSDPDPEGSYNYIRNSVKIVVDAYNGSVRFYTMEEKDPIIQTYKRIFPELFIDFEEMPSSLKDNVRYPEEMFNSQLRKYRRYHMTEPQVFYNNEDLWARPREYYADRSIAMQPYYVLMELPDKEGLEFLLMMPYTPDTKDNMIAWIAARSDPPNYGELVTYQLPKERLIYGPNQVESRIDQDTQISQQLSLWDQRGSQVIRGNLMVIPVEQSFLYIEPVFLIAQQTQIPQLQRVIVANGNQIAMEPTLEQSLQQLFGKRQREVATPLAETQPGQPAPRQETAAYAENARNMLSQAQQALQNGQWANFGQYLDSLRQILSQPPLPAPSPTDASPQE